MTRHASPPLSTKLSIRAGPDRRRDGMIHPQEVRAMHYALLIYSAPDAPDEPTPGDGVIESWVAYTEAMRRAGALVTAAHPEPIAPAPRVPLPGGQGHPTR